MACAAAIVAKRSGGGVSGRAAAGVSMAPFAGTANQTALPRTSHPASRDLVRW